MKIAHRWGLVALVTVAAGPPSAVVVKGTASAPSNIVAPPDITWSGLEPQEAPPPPRHRAVHPQQKAAQADPKLFEEFKEFLEWKKTHP